MTDFVDPSRPVADTSRPAASTTPTGLQSTAEIARRRFIVITLNSVTYLALMAWLASVLGLGGWSAIDILLFACFAVGSPWTVLGFWNAVIGLWLLHGVRDPERHVAPFAAAGRNGEPLRLQTAVLMTLRNEDPTRAILRLRTVEESIGQTGFGDHFCYFVLSDTSLAAVADAEERMIAEWRSQSPHPHRIVYRRRTSNDGFKAGNVRDFCERWGGSFELMLPLDADSLMSGETIVRMVRMMQAHPRLGILQSLVVGMPSSSAFARIFQFGMRQGMRPYTMGSAWWMADCGPFWGHNALVRIAPFVEHCHLPVLPGKPPFGGHVMSHDQVEATMMRRGGFEVRVWPEECDSWEENPPTIADFSRRDVRWCQGNLQYAKLLNLKGLLPTSRFQLVWAILMFIGVPAWTAMIALAAVKVFDGEDPAAFPAASAAALYTLFLLMYLSPKLAGFADILIRRGEAERYGGRLNFIAGAVTELVFSFLVGAATTLRITIFMVGLLFGRSATWNGQSRDAHRLSWRGAAEGLWPQLVFGVVVNGLFLVFAPAALPWALPLTLGYLVAIPFAVISSIPALGDAMAKSRFAGIPEEFATPWEIAVIRGEAPLVKTPDGAAQAA